jgi:prepilin-type N-terminal cleavage/methylation domain-containing protein
MDSPSIDHVTCRRDTRGGHRAEGFSLLEMMMVVTVILIVASIATLIYNIRDSGLGIKDSGVRSQKSEVARTPELGDRAASTHATFRLATLDFNRSTLDSRLSTSRLRVPRCPAPGLRRMTFCPLHFLLDTPANYDSLESW